MLTFLRYSYRVTRPRITTQNMKNLFAKRLEMIQAKQRIQRQSTQYLNKIEDEFLENHKKMMAQRHIDNECAFRCKIARNSYILYESLEKEKIKHQEKLQRIEKFIREEQIKRLNRDRIKKILQYESANFWLEGDKISQKFIADRVLPQYIGATEYYHKLYSEAMAYDDLDFDMLHRMSSNEEATQYKNKLLIPIYKQVLILMKEVKFSDEERANKQFQDATTKLINLYGKDSQRVNLQIKKLKELHEKKIQSIKQKQNTPEARNQYLKTKLKNLVLLLKKWKQYTDILGKTSNQIHKIIADTSSEEAIIARKKVLEKEIQKKRETTFVDPIEQDTEDEQVTLSSYLAKKQEPSPIKPAEASSSLNDQLSNLLKDHKSLLNEIATQIREQEIELNSKFDVTANLTKDAVEDLTFNQDLKIDEGFLQPSETTTSIQVMKQKFSGDQTIRNLLNLAGELTIEYPKLFKKVWDIQIL